MANIGRASDMSDRARHQAFFGPTAVTVHDDCDMLGRLVHAQIVTGIKSCMSVVMRWCLLNRSTSTMARNSPSACS